MVNPVTQSKKSRASRDQGITIRTLAEPLQQVPNRRRVPLAAPGRDDPPRVQLLGNRRQRRSPRGPHIGDRLGILSRPVGGVLTNSLDSRPGALPCPAERLGPLRVPELGPGGLGGCEGVLGPVGSELPLPLRNGG